jgi:hypothetical protein
MRYDPYIGGLEAFVGFAIIIGFFAACVVIGAALEVRWCLAVLLGV